MQPVPETPRDEPAETERTPEPAAAETVPEKEDPNRPKRSGWWQRRSFF
jgi:ribonuclease E